MTNQLIIAASLFYIYFVIGGLATTNILRLTANNTLTVLFSKCYCDNCGYKIPPHLQLPIISYIVCKGKCKNCGIKIPIFPLILEISLFGGMSLITALLKFSMVGVSLSYLFYEAVRILIIILKGKRENQFAKQYCIAVFSMIPLYLLTLFVALLYTIV